MSFLNKTRTNFFYPDEKTTIAKLYTPIGTFEGLARWDGKNPYKKNYGDRIARLRAAIKYVSALEKNAVKERNFYIVVSSNKNPYIAPRKNIDDKIAQLIMKANSLQTEKYLLKMKLKGAIQSTEE